MLAGVRKTIDHDSPRLDILYFARCCVVPSCAACATSAEVDGIYSTSLETAEIDRITATHPKGSPLFIYMALHSVHGPNEDPFPLVDVNDTFGEVVAYDRRIFAVCHLAP